MEISSKTKNTISGTMSTMSTVISSVTISTDIQRQICCLIYVLFNLIIWKMKIKCFFEGNSKEKEWKLIKTEKLGKEKGKIG